MNLGEWRTSPSASTHHARPRPPLDQKASTLIAAVGCGVLAGQMLAFWIGFFTPIGWHIMKFPCQCAWTLLAFPLGWLGFIAGAFTSTQSVRYLLLGTGIVLNAGLWGSVAYRIIKFRREQAGYCGFDASSISAPIQELRHHHAAAAHSRWKPPYARMALVGAARRTISQCGYFFGLPKEEHKQPTTLGSTVERE